MDERVIMVAIGVVALGLYVKGVPQRLWSLIRGGGGSTLASVIGQSTASDGTPQSAGAVNASQANGVLPGMQNTQPGGGVVAPSSIAALVALHQQALSTPGVDPQLDDLTSKLPATNDPHQQTWVAAFRDCYGAGDTVSTCAARATSTVGWSPFG